ncbi:dihydroorotate dehydrogenase [Candidatus Peregrinibacteria bacterium]|jgi:dihydroorotate dehydrogenase (NAD+) catalytic subunit|nr:dihydroorotate dehydrogenase [Candidatus Peregrinibacteria bacterium]
MANLKVKFCEVEFENPLVLASGVLGVTAASLKNVVKNGAGGVTTKSIWMEEHKGHANPTMFGTEHYFLNAVGLSDAGIEKAEQLFGEYGVPGERPAPLIASIVAGQASEFAGLAERIVTLQPDVIEVNISCPNVEDEMGLPFACDPMQAAHVTEVVRKKMDEVGSKIPVVVKLSPNVPNISRIAAACADAGADGFCAINTIGPGMAIDLTTRVPILKNKVGGLSGPAIKPIAVKMVHDIWKTTGLPVIGTGGVMTGEDAIEMMMAGATLVGVGTMVYYRDVGGFGEIAAEMNEWCEKEGVKDLSEIIGTVK